MKFDGSMLQDTIESAYFTFRKRLRNIDQASVCPCKACPGMGNSTSSSSLTTARS